MNAMKRIVESEILNRKSHADVFELGSPTSMVILIGGSGVDQRAYEQRMNSTIPIFSALLQSLEAARLDVLLAHITAPYDVPLRGPKLSPETTNRWNDHVLRELLEPWSDLPFLVSGFSGGALLALRGLHADARCVGGAVFGADELSENFSCPPHWEGKLGIFTAPHDRVCSVEKNRQRYQAMEHRGEAEIFRLRSGSHQLADYATEDGLGTVMRTAQRYC